jgi:hypothetical protein
MLLLAVCSLSPPAFSLESEWLAHWRRIEDRGGRPDAQGALLQWAGDPQYLEYPFDQSQAAFPLSGEWAWQQAPRGSRLYVQSITEFSLTHQIELKDAWALGQGVSIGVQYHQLADRQTQSHLARLVLGGDEVAGSPLVFELSLFPRWDKEDIDLEAFVGLRAAALGEVRLRIIALDPFINASYALAESRGAVLEEVFEQHDPGFALALEGASVRWQGLRAELYGGLLLPHMTERRVPEGPATEHTRSGHLAGGLLEWAGPLTVGLTGLHVHARDTWRPAPGRRIDESLTEGRFYALAEVVGARIEGQLRVSTRDFREEGDAPRALGALHRLWALRGWWPAEGVVAGELGLMRVDRDPHGQPPAFVDADAAHRLVTRVAVNLPPLWLALGVGWDLEPADGRYDGGGLTLILVE